MENKKMISTNKGMFYLDRLVDEDGSGIQFATSIADINYYYMFPLGMTEDEIVKEINEKED